jgi:putative endopeptidase
VTRVSGLTRPGILSLAFTLALAGVGAAAPPPPWSGGDQAVRPGQDFYQFANGGWLAQAVIPPDRAGFSTATVLSQAAEARVRDLLEAAAAGAGQAPDDETGKVGAYYAAFMDAPRIEALGGRPLAAGLAAIRAARSRTALARLMGRAGASFQGDLFTLTIEPDSRDPDRWAVYLAQGGLGLPNRESYLDRAAAPLRSAYEPYVARLLALAGWPRPNRAARSVLALETRVAAASWDAADERDEAKIYTPVSLKALARRAPEFPWNAYFAAAGLRPSRIVLVEQTAIPALSRIFASARLADLEAWAAFHLADNAAPYLSSPFADAWFDLHGRRLQGATATAPRWRRAVRLVSGGGSKDVEDSRGAMGDAVGRMYVARWFDARSRDTLQALVSRLRETLHDRITASTWISAQARAEALLKVGAYRVEIGAPDHGDTYEGLVIRRDDLFGDIERATAADWARQRARLSRPVDRGLWSMTPQTVNAYNYAPFDEVVFTAALLQPPAFDPAEDPGLAYGGIGAIIGHELTHGFDDQGRRFDHAGQLRDWWTPADAAGFAARAARLVALYAGCEALPGLKVDGRLTLGENIADIGGLQLALDAYHASLAGRPAPVVDGLTGDQRVFLGFALLRRGKRRPEAVRADVASDPHTPDACRVNEAVRNLDAWYDAFEVRPGDALYLPPADRTRIW